MKPAFKRKVRAICLALAIMSVHAEARADLAAGLAAVEHGDYARAVEELQPLAEQGDAKAQMALGRLYLIGHGVPKDDAKAAQWFRRAAEQGNADGQEALAMSYMIGTGVPVDTAEAIKWNRLAAEQGSSSAQFGLGVLYSRGLGTERDMPEAITWFKRAGEQGELRAYLILGEIYEKGEGVPQDLSQARAYYEKAAASTNTETHDKAAGAMSRITQGKAGPDLSKTDAALTAYRAGRYGEALKLLQPIAAGGNAPAQHIVGSMYEKGQGTTQDFAEAANWYKRAADQGNANALSALAILYMTGKGVPLDYREAQRLLRKSAAVPQQPPNIVAATWQLHETIWLMDPKIENAAWKPFADALAKNDTASVLSEGQKLVDSGGGVAAYVMAQMYLNGKGVPIDAAKGIALLTVAAERGVAKAQSGLGYRYMTGEGVEKDRVRARTLFEAAAEQDEPEGATGLCYLYQSGIGVAADRKQAVSWCLRAAADYPPGPLRTRVLELAARMTKP